MKESSMGAFQFFLNCTNGTKSHKTLQKLKEFMT